MSPSSTSSSEPDDAHGAPAPVLGDAPAQDDGGHQVRPVRHRSTRSVVLWALGAICVLLLAGELVARVLAPLPINRTWPDNESQFKAEHALAVEARGGREELVFAGSSVGGAAFDPATVVEAGDLDVDAFNYAQEGALAATTARWLDAVVLDQVDPDVVVLGVFPGDIGAFPTGAAAIGDQLEASRGYRMASGNPNLGDRIEDAASRRSALVRHREILRDPYRLALWVRSPWTPGFLDAETGALLRHRDATFAPFDPDDTAEGDELAPTGPEIQAIEDLAESLAADGRRLVIVELPVYDAVWDETDYPGARATTHDAMVAIDDGTCAERLDLRDLAQDERYWSDGVHVNGNGTEVISQAVGEWLAANPEAPTDC